VATWTMGGTAILDTAVIGNAPTVWTIQGTNAD
jgi:hypothetical protein